VEQTPVDVEPNHGPRRPAGTAVVVAVLLLLVSVTAVMLAGGQAGQPVGAVASLQPGSLPPTVAVGPTATTAVVGPSAIESETEPGATVPPGWALVLDDQFNSGGVPDEWSVYNGPFGSGQRNCAVPSHVSVANGNLQLLMAYETSGKCGPGWYTAGMQVKRDFGGVDQRISLRWRITGTNLNAVQGYLNMPMRWVADPNYPWYEGESDYCEGARIDGCTINLHYGDTSTAITAFHQIDLTQWHTWTIEHLNHRVTIWVDGELLWDYQGTEATVPNAFRVTVLQQECYLHACPPVALSSDTETVEIDWIQIENRA
jgi:hypothetical protein